MPGPGTKTDIPTADVPPARLLDVTRIVRRAGRVATGVDRVELAYLRALLDAPEPLFVIARTKLGYILCDETGAQALQDAWLALESRKQAETLMRRYAVDRTVPWRLPHMIIRHLPRGFAYLNVGHSNLTDRVLNAVKYAGGRVAVMIHDTIPLDFPDMQRAETAPKFRAMLDRVGQFADLLICNSKATEDDIARHLSPMPPSVVAHLGVEVANPNPDDLPADLPPNAPYFVTVGTIEPRKNHALLLDIWEDIAKDATPPTLVICGHRGWLNGDVFARLDAHPKGVIETPNLSDEAIAALLAGAAGALFPSYAEGYGLPPIEAAAVKCPLICADLPVYGEILGDIAVYVDPLDSYLWAKKIKGLAKTERADQSNARDFSPPTWDTHFNVILGMT